MVNPLTPVVLGYFLDPPPTLLALLLPAFGGTVPFPPCPAPVDIVDIWSALLLLFLPTVPDPFPKSSRDFAVFLVVDFAYSSFIAAKVDSRLYKIFNIASL